MFDSTLIDVAISMCFIYFAMSLTCAAVNELIVRMLDTRSKELKGHIRALLTDEGKRDAFYKHPLIKKLNQNRNPKDDTESSMDIESIPTNVFTMALLDVVAPLKADAGGNPTLSTFDSLVKSVETLPDSEMRNALKATLSTAEGSLASVRKNVDTWFDSRMELATQLYRKKTQYITFIIALLVTIAMNVDSIHIARTLYFDPDVRNAFVGKVLAGVKDGTITADSASDEIDAAMESFSVDTNLPIGWDEWCERHTYGLSGESDTLPSGAWGVLTALVLAAVGWTITAFASAAGAPFWFDFLNRFIAFRKTVTADDRG